jgi:hypothetical protein
MYPSGGGRIRPLRGAKRRVIGCFELVCCRLRTKAWNVRASDSLTFSQLKPSSLHAVRVTPDEGVRGSIFTGTAAARTLPDFFSRPSRYAYREFRYRCD